MGLGAIAGSFKYGAPGYVKIGSVVLAFFIYIFYVFYTMNYMVREGEYRMVALFNTFGTWDDKDKKEWNALSSIFRLCAPVSELLPIEIAEYRLEDATYAANNIQSLARQNAVENQDTTGNIES
jgi:hypothetical protein